MRNVLKDALCYNKQRRAARRKVEMLGVGRRRTQTEGKQFRFGIHKAKLHNKVSHVRK